MKEEIEKLIHLQTIDSQIAGFDQAIGKQHNGLYQREHSIEEKKERMQTLQSKITLLNQKQQETKADHDDAGVRVKDRQNKMILVQTSREHQALLKEIEENKRIVKETEERLLQFMEQIEELVKEKERLANQLTTEEQLLLEARQQVEKEVKQLESSKKNIVGERTQKAAALEASHSKLYAKLLLKREGLAVVELREGVCLGCRMALPPQQVNEVRRADKLNTCPTCQRILYYKEPEEEALVVK